MYRFAQYASRVRPFISPSALDLSRPLFHHLLFYFSRFAIKMSPRLVIGHAPLIKHLTTISKSSLISDTASPRQRRHAGPSSAGLPSQLCLPLLSSPSAHLACRIPVLILLSTLIYINSLARPRQSQAIGAHPPLLLVFGF